MGILAKIVTLQNAKSLKSCDSRLSVGFDTLAESGGFEPAELLHSTVFKTAAIDHSANSPPQKYKYGAVLQIMIHLN